jgi:radical SAM superfamily enzyme YgiQ (UPF0313 family)
MDYFNVVSMLRRAGIPPLAQERDERHPLLLAGGPAVSANPEPLAPLLDAVVIGEVEPIFERLTDALHGMGNGRDAVLEALTQIPGLYLPGLDGPADSEKPGIGRQTVTRQWLPDLDSFPSHSSLFTPDTEFADMGLIEIARGCGRGCRFCLAGYVYRPPRQRSVEKILEQAQELLRHVKRIGLVSAAVSDYDDIDLLATELRRMGAQISVSSLRVDPVSEPLIRALAESGAQTLTIAPEAGSERLRRVINKTQREADVLRAVDLAAGYGLAQIKLYFMLGLPGETEEDVEAIVKLAQTCAGRFQRQVTVNITPFVPKAHTPFQRQVQMRAKEVKRRLDYVNGKLKRQGIGVRSESPNWAEVQGTLARGDQRVAQALLAVGRLSPASWRLALKEAGLSAKELLGERPDEESLPWAFIQSGVRQAYLEREMGQAGAERTTPPCPPEDCAVCGVCA